MKRFDIKNLSSQQITHSYIAETAINLQPEWGEVGSYEILESDISADYALEQCRLNRLKAYPALGDFADAFVKMQNGDSTAMDAYVAACLAVKAQFPKP